jgi:uncharacterized protein YndB with AHSA1/START domain
LLEDPTNRRLITMATEKEELTLGRISSESVREATGRGWEDWLEALDAAGAADWDVAATAAEAWELITSRPELWLGERVSVAFDEGEQYEVPPGNGAPGASGEVRVVKPGDRLRMTWQPEGWPAPATLQLTLSESGSGKTAIHAHLEKLPHADAREAMRTRWREALERIATAAR